jgi:hypothetical protein
VAFCWPAAHVTTGARELLRCSRSMAPAMSCGTRPIAPPR